MKSFADTVAQIMKNLVAGPIGAQDMNAGDEFVNKPDKHYGRDEDADLYREDEELGKSVVPQHYISSYGAVEVLFKSGPPAMLIKANDELRDDITDREIVVGGYASPQVIDREKHLIQKEAMIKDLPRFLAEPLFANAMILHSNVQVGQVLKEWTNPKTGKEYRTQVDDIGLFCVIKIRTDQYRPKIVDKVVEDIEKGNLKAFSISGDAPLDSRQHKCADGECFWVIPSIEFYEITICLPGHQQIYTSTGLRKIKDIRVGELVLTHKLRWRPVLRTMQRQIDDSIVRLTLDNGKFLEATREHPVRALRYRGRNEGTHYEWVPAGEIKEGDLVSFHEPNGTCRACGRLIFRQWKKGSHIPNFCDAACKAEVPNRKGKTMASGDQGAIAQAKKMRGRTGGTGGPAYWTEEGRAKHNASVTSKDFRAKAKTRATLQWQDPSFVQAQMKARGVRPNKLEKSFGQLLRPLGFSYVGDGRLVIGGKVPDYHDGSDKIIELYGDYWHKGQDPKDRIDFFRARGYETLVVWERDLKSDREQVRERVAEFIQNKLERVVKVEHIPFEGLVYNLEVAEDNSYVTEAMATHNCEEGVNQGAKLMILSKSCADGKCGLAQKGEELVQPGKTLKDTSGAATGSLGGEKATGTGNIGKDGGASPIPEGTDTDQPKPTPQAALPTGVLDMDADATKETLTERVGEIADVVGEKEAVELVEDVVEASEKLDNVGTGIGSGGAGDANTMADFGKPYSPDTAKARDPGIKQAADKYEEYMRNGGSPEDIYFKMLESGAPDWFGMRTDSFRQFLVEIYRRGLSIPTIRLRMAGRTDGDIVADPSMTAFDLLQTAINRMRGMIDKDVSPVAHEDHDEDCEREEVEQSERYYLNLALKSLSKHRDRQGSTDHHKKGGGGKGIATEPSAALAGAPGAGDQGGPDEEEPMEQRVATLTKLIKEKNAKGASLRLSPGRRGGVYTVAGIDENGQPVRLVGNVSDITEALRGDEEVGEEGEQEVPEITIDTVAAKVKGRNLGGARLRLLPGDGNSSYRIVGVNELRIPLNLFGEVEALDAALEEDRMKVLNQRVKNTTGRKMNMYAVPIDVGKVNEVRIYEGDGVSPMEMVREQVARASFTAAVATVMKQPTRGWQARDYRIDDEQQTEPENVSVMGGTRFPGNRNQEGHATTEIEQGGDVEGISGTKINIPTEPLDTPPAAGIAQQGAISPPRGIQGVGEKPEFIQVHDDQPMHGVREENEGTGLDPRADADNRGAPVAHKTQRP